MIPLNDLESSIYDQLTRTFFDVVNFSSEISPTAFATENISINSGTSWLLAQQNNIDELVILSWDSRTAIRTTWGIFVTYWQEFCYPSSDDLVVFPLNDEWALLYWHEEEFHYNPQRLSEGVPD